MVSTYSGMLLMRPNPTGTACVPLQVTAVPPKLEGGGATSMAICTCATAASKYLSEKTCQSTVGFCIGPVLVKVRVSVRVPCDPAKVIVSVTVMFGAIGRSSANRTLTLFFNDTATT